MDNNTDRNLVVDVKNLHISFKTFKGYSKVLNGVNLQVHKRERIAIVGETGCGKTTTVSAIAQILAKQARVDKGEIFFNGKSVLKMNAKELKKNARKRHFDYLSGSDCIIESCLYNWKSNA